MTNSAPKQRSDTADRSSIAPKVARFVFGALQGALLVKRTTDDPSQFSDVIAVMKLQLAARR
ncbi:hypothetical protein [Bradyrhizobium sp. Ash2021]|uniref:hypothetical protein n=1 Tax=Bradyrhizobium sp. Ash2021 TaxID=2954771 RepID=UPI002814BAC7|nr:hypothetical protein [Bradyrhizobium sp. Ash2021]WMT74937.1 hypothetical protein NL528_00355 [Bradyrhizobium sp. Ash2021]